MEKLTCFEKVIDIILAAGAVGTVGTLIATIIQNRKQNRRISSLEEKQIDAKYRPDLSVSDFVERVTGQNKISLTIENNGEEVEIIDFECSFLDKQTIVLPENFKKGDQRVFYIKSGATFFPKDFTMKMKVKDKLGRLYWVPLKMRKTGPYVDSFRIEEMKQK